MICPIRVTGEDGTTKSRRAVVAVDVKQKTSLNENKSLIRETFSSTERTSEYAPGNTVLCCINSNMGNHRLFLKIAHVAAYKIHLELMENTKAVADTVPNLILLGNADKSPSLPLS